MRYLSLIILLSAALSLPVCASTPKNPDSPFGVICPWGEIKDAGIEWVRCGAGCTALDWGAIEKSRGVFDWKDADNEVNGAIRNEGADLLPILGYTPKWASSGPNGENGYPPKDLSDWSDFVYRIVNRYKNKIKYWEVWNEPDIGFWQGTVEQYSDLLKSAYMAAKKADPDCKIVFGGTAGVNLPFVERVYQNGGKYYFDVMAVHPYQWGDTFDGEWFCLQLRNLHDLMRKYGDGGKEIWLTEFGWSTGDQGITEEIQARLLAQGFITALTLRDVNITRAFWFCVKDWGGPGYGLFRDDGTRKPAFDAYRVVAQTLDGAEYVHTTQDSRMNCYTFAKNGKQILVYWSKDKEPDMIRLTREGRFTALRRINGDEEQIPGKDVPVMIGPDPVFILGNHPATPPARKLSCIKPSISYRLDVWCGISAPKGTARLYVMRGSKSFIPVEIHNDSIESVTASITGKIGLFTAKAETSVMKPGETQQVMLQFDLPGTFKLGLDKLTISGLANGKAIAPIVTPIRIAPGPVVEFLANSIIENQYLVENNGSGGAPSVRFNGTWTYKFDLTNASGGTLSLYVGAHQANEWRALLSADQKTWVTALSGRSNRSWHDIDLGAFGRSTLYVKFEGNDQQLSELVLVTRPL